MKILLLASGGDAPGMNAFLAQVYNGFNKKDVYCCVEGYKGLIENNIKKMEEFEPNKHKNEAGSMIFSSRSKEFQTEEGFKKGLENAKNFDVVVILGGNGSCEGAKRLKVNGINTIFVPGTIDNDVDGSEYSIGFDTAVKECCYSIENTMPSMNSFSRACVFEVMGRNSSEIAKEVAKRSNADYLICDDIDLDYEKIAEVISNNYANHKGSVVVVRENIIKLTSLIDKINENMTIRDIIRGHIVGHVQRGGRPTECEIAMANGFAKCCVKAIKKNNLNVGIYVENGNFVTKNI